MKRVFYLVIISLLLIGFVIPGCGAPSEQVPTIDVSVAGPMMFLQGEHIWYGAEMARDEINAAGGINLGSVAHKINLVKTDTNEILSIPDAVTAIERAITVDKVDLIIGGFHGEAIFPMTEVAMDYKKLIIVCGASEEAIIRRVVDDYDRYKYLFRGTPYNDHLLGVSLFKVLGTVGVLLTLELVEAEQNPELNVNPDYALGFPPKPLRVAIMAEDMEWADSVIDAAMEVLPLLNMEVVEIQRPSDTAESVHAELTAIAAKKPHIIFTILSATAGIPYSKERAELGIPALSVGINVEGQRKGFWESTDGGCEYDIILDAYAEGVQQTGLTKTFFEKFVAKTGEYPTYTADTYWALYGLKEVIESVAIELETDDIADIVDPDNIDVLIKQVEKTKREVASGTIAYYPMPEGPTIEEQPTLSEDQVLALYPGVTYVPEQWTIPPHNAHDLVYGPAYATGVGAQWQAGRKVGIWPLRLLERLPDIWKEQVSELLFDQYGNWDFAYPGTADIVIPISWWLVD